MNQVDDMRLTRSSLMWDQCASGVAFSRVTGSVRLSGMEALSRTRMWSGIPEALAKEVSFWIRRTERKCKI